MRALGAVLLGIVAAIVLFPLFGWIGSTIPRNANATTPADGITIMVESNGTHTGIVMPVISPVKDWRETFPSASLPRQRDGQLPTHIAVGWGEREVFLDVPRWSDLRYTSALRIAIFGGDAVMRVSPYVRPAPGPDYRPVVVSRTHYARMVEEIEASLAPPRPDGTRAVLRGTSADDAYYAALGKYTLANTCNSWVGDRLAAAGLQMGWWTPFAGGVMKWIEPPQERPAHVAQDAPPV